MLRTSLSRFTRALPIHKRIIHKRFFWNELRQIGCELWTGVRDNIMNTTFVADAAADVAIDGVIGAAAGGAIYGGKKALNLLKMILTEANHDDVIDAVDVMNICLARLEKENLKDPNPSITMLLEKSLKTQEQMVVLFKVLNAENPTNEKPPTPNWWEKPKIEKELTKMKTMLIEFRQMYRDVFACENYIASKNNKRYHLQTIAAQKKAMVTQKRAIALQKKVIAAQKKTFASQEETKTLVGGLKNAKQDALNEVIQLGQIFEIPYVEKLLTE